jgi:hypothetical protein
VDSNFLSPKLESLVTKETTIFGRVPIRQRCFFVRIMAIETVFFSLFFTFDVMQAAVNIIVGKGGGRFFGSIEEEDEDTCADYYK